MDLEYLLFLQNNVRTDVLTPIMMGISDFAISFYLMAIVFMIYWCFNKRSGLALIFATVFGGLINSIFKLSFCIYRPWVRDPSIVPAANAKVSATGYSFPSGHSQESSSLMGTGSYLVWNKKRWFAVCLIIFVLLVGFSRNYLGVHTPQDVIVGLLLGCYSIYKTVELLKTNDNSDKKTDLKLLGKGFLIAVLSILYFSFKNYPINYDETGNILVDPNQMMIGGFASIGMWTGFLFGWFVEKHYIAFSIDSSVKMRILRGAIGIFTLWLVLLGLRNYLAPLCTPCWAAFLVWAIELFYVTAIYPFIFKHCRF